MTTLPITDWLLKLSVCLFGLACCGSVSAFQSGTRDQASDQQTSLDVADGQAESVDDQIDANVGVTYSDSVTSHWEVGFQAVAVKNSASDLLVILPIPNQWPEQKVTAIAETIPPEVGKVRYRDLDCGVRQLMISVPKLRTGTEVRVLMTFKVTTSQINLPADTAIFLAPKRNHREGKPYIGVGPQLNYRDAKLRKQVKEITANKENVWQEVEAIFQWVRDNIDLRAGDPRDVTTVFRERYGCAEDLVGMFVAMCRAHKIPARMVWVEGKQYAEFMLVDDQKNAHWFPCVVAGLPEFGSLSEPRIILQKGDSIRVPEKDQRQKYVAEFAACKGKSKPVINFVRHLIPIE